MVKKRLRGARVVLVGGRKTTRAYGCVAYYDEATWVEVNEISKIFRALFVLKRIRISEYAKNQSVVKSALAKFRENAEMLAARDRAKGST